MNRNDDHTSATGTSQGKRRGGRTRNCSAARDPERARATLRHGRVVRAVLCKRHGPPESLVVEDVPSPTPGPGEVVVSVKAASVNFPDVLIIQNKYQVKPPLPFSPGSEVAGIVKAVGGGVTHVKPGDRVMAIIGYGAFAEEVKVEGRRVLPLPAGMDFESAAAFGLTYA